MNEPIRAIRDPEQRPPRRPATELGTTKTTWVDIALGIYVGGIALAVTSAVFWIIVVGIGMKIITIR